MTTECPFYEFSDIGISGWDRDDDAAGLEKVGVFLDEFSVGKRKLHRSDQATLQPMVLTGWVKSPDAFIPADHVYLVCLNAGVI